MEYKVTVIIPTYNVENHISRAIDSVKKQSLGFENIEIIIVDDGSTDKTKKILNSFSKKYENIKCFFNKENSGAPGRGRNIGIKNASSDYIMFLDSDDIFSSDMCKVMYNTIEKTGANVVMCNHTIIYNNDFSKIEENTSDISYIKLNPKQNKDIFRDGYVWNKIFRKEFLYEFNIYCLEDCFAEDSYICINTYLHTNELIFLKNFKGYLYNVRDIEGDSSTVNKFSKKDFEKFLIGFYNIIDLLRKEGTQKLINCLMKKEFVILLSEFVRIDVDKKSRLILLEDFYKFQELCCFKENVNEKWADILLKNIQKRRFNRVIFYSKILNKFYNLYVIRKFYRKMSGKN